MSRAVANSLEQVDRVCIFSHYDPDGDALGSSLGLMHLLERMGKKVWVHSAGPIPEEYGFLPGMERVSEDFPSLDEIECAVLLDCHQPERSGQAEAEYLAQVERVVVVDHHQGSVDIGDPAWVDPGFAATSQMLAQMAIESEWQMGQAAAVCLFTGLQTDTGSFRYSNATPEAFRIAANLVEAGADPWMVSQEVYATRVTRLRLLSRILENLSVSTDGRLAIGQAFQADFKDLDADPRDLEEAVESIRGIPGVEVAALLRERGSSGVKISMRSRGGVDVAAVAISLGGGGHRNAAGLRLDKPMAEAKELISSRLQEALEAGK
jgi:phosphoesterase RecJ-like protein